MDFYAPEKTIALNAKRYRTNEQWLTQGLKKCARKCLTMYDKVLKKPRDSPEFQNYKQYSNMYNKLRRKAKFQYYNELIQETKHNSKKRWAILNKLTGKVVNKKEITDEILVNRMKETNKQLISNAFAKHYSEVGKILANMIEEKGNI